MGHSVPFSVKLFDSCGSCVNWGSFGHTAYLIPERALNECDMMKGSRLHRLMGDGWINGCRAEIILTHWPPRRFGRNFRSVIFKLNLMINGRCTSCEVVLSWMYMVLIDDKSTLGQAITWWPSPISPYALTRLKSFKRDWNKWNSIIFHTKMSWVVEIFPSKGTHLHCIANIIVAYGLVTQLARTSSAMVLT